MNGTSIFGCQFASVSACVTGKFYQMGRSNVRRRHRNLLDYPDSHNLWNTQILTRIWPLLTRLPDDSLLLLQPDRAFTNIISYLQVQLLFVFPRVSFRVWAFLYSAKLMWLKFLHLLKKKIWKSILHKSLIHSKIRRFFFFVDFWSRWFFDIFEFNPDQIRKAASEQVRCSIVARNTSLVNQRDIHWHTVRPVFKISGSI